MLVVGTGCLASVSVGISMAALAVVRRAQRGAQTAAGVAVLAHSPMAQAVAVGVGVG